MKRFIIKKLQERTPSVPWSSKQITETKETPIKEEKVMDTKEKVELAQAVLASQELDTTPKVKKVRKDKGLIERVDRPSIILTEDNKELLND